MYGSTLRLGQLLGVNLSMNISNYTNIRGISRRHMSVVGDISESVHTFSKIACSIPLNGVKICVCDAFFYRKYRPNGQKGWFRK